MLYVSCTNARVLPPHYLLVVEPLLRQLPHCWTDPPTPTYTHEHKTPPHKTHPPTHPPVNATHPPTYLPTHQPHEDTQLDTSQPAHEPAYYSSTSRSVASLPSHAHTTHAHTPPAHLSTTYRYLPEFVNTSYDFSSGHSKMTYLVQFKRKQKSQTKIHTIGK